ncbi:GDP-mannose 4,6-dehydratase [Ferruginibacter albus]|uniref:GDP-mannose 4,6-dehydratase n=1 Tax=Ferruginibacter albus TaxID=2875540 RepID=UPI001CC7E6F5|nr:GDP-mannose 4,6-dehydratase [Ferruginibacter albus]UAY53121.1 GDP-mannose 4,6-dehydratase [Ferruginibacter albus]
MTALIFGANGQDGFYLTELLQSKGIAVIGIGRKAAINIIDYTSICDTVNQYKPDFIFHFAANSTTRHDALFENHEVISTGTLNILEAVKKFSPATKVFISGSGLQFVNNNQPIKETDPFEARDAYSIARIQSVYAARYFRRLGLKVYVGYFFNHDSPRRTERHMAMKISAAVKRIADGSDEKLEIGDSSVIKEWTYAGDVVKGVWTLVNQDKVWEANLGSGLGYSIDDWISISFKLIGKDPKDHVVKTEGFTAEYRQLVSDSSLAFSLGWKPEVSFEQLAKMMLQ